MPEAIATTKRKFYKALDSITSASQASLVLNPTDSNKRHSTAASAYEEARERARKRLRHSTSTASLSELNSSVISLPRKSPAKHKDGDAKAPAPHFSPWSQDTFLARLKTFSSVSLWHPKPDPIGEVEWAKRGWVCVDVNTVACKGGCDRRVVVSLESPAKANSGDDERDVDMDDEEAAELEEALAERYKAEIIDGHADSCMWHKAGCKDDIYRLPVVRSTVWQPELRKRFQSLRGIADSIDNVKTRNITPTDQVTVTDLPRDVIPPTDATHPVASKALAIALHGWRGTSDSGNDLLHCDACFQRVGLWMYQPGYRRASTASTATATTTADADAPDTDPTTIDLVEMHRDHCPWRNPHTQHTTGSLAGLNAAEILHRVAATCVRDQRRRSAAHDPAGGAPRDEEVASPEPGTPSSILSREEVARQDKERESRMRKLKGLFNIKRRSGVKTPTKGAAV
jgi:hypothetical protein